MIFSLNNNGHQLAGDTLKSLYGHLSLARKNQELISAYHPGTNGYKGTRSNSSSEKVSEEEKRAVEKLKRTDAKVKAHERAHMSAGAGLIQGGANYQYQRGPDGKMYATGGDVKIDVSPENNPRATMQKMEQVKRAALAPAQPSGQDRAVAAQAMQVESQARAELSKLRMEEGKEKNEKPDTQLIKDLINIYSFNTEGSSFDLIA